MANMGIVPVMGMEELQGFQEDELKQQEERVDVFNDNLAGHIRSAWQIAKEAKRPIEEVMIRCLRQRNGIYEADKLAAIREMGGSEIYVLITLSKCRAAEAWISDVLRPAGDQPWTIEPTPIPELNPIYEQEVQREVMTEAQAIQQEIMALGIDISTVPKIQEALMDYQKNLRERLIDESYEEAKEAADKMTKVMLDQQIQGRFIDSFKQVMNDVITLKAGIMKGPVIRMKKEKKYKFDGQKWNIELVDTLVPEFDRVSPFDFYPAAGSTGVDDGDIIERHFMTRGDLVSLLGVPGYKEESIREVLSQYQQGTFFEQLPVDMQRYMVEHGETGTKNRTKKFEVLEYWGSVPGKYLLDWGMEGDIDEEKEYEINAWMVKNIVIKAVVNPDKLGRKPYSVTSFEKIPGAIWGKGIPEMMSDIQDVCNAVARAIVNNAQLASGPMVEVNVDKCASNTAMHPWKIFQSTNQTMQESPAIHFYQPQMYVAPLQQVYEFFSLASDESTGVPRWAYGNTNVGGAGNTSSGLSMLMTYAARGIKQVIQNFDDDLISPILQRQYDYNMIYNNDESIKGDVRIVARGSSALIAREQQVLRFKEILQLTANPIDLQLLGLDTRLEMIKKMFKAMDIELESMPDPENIQNVIDSIKQQLIQQQTATAQAQAVPENQQAQMNGQAPQAKAPQTDNAGNVAGGRDQNINIQARAGGGPVQAGKPYLVGENGPEIIVPTDNGTVVPNNNLNMFVNVAKDTLNDAASAYGINTGQWLDRVGLHDLGKETEQYWRNNLTDVGKREINKPPIDANGVNASAIAMNYLVDPVNVLAPELKYASPLTRAERLDPIISAYAHSRGITAIPRTTKLAKVPGTIADAIEMITDQFGNKSDIQANQAKKRAAGGPITAGQPYLVGEQGPEMVIPNSNGTVMSAPTTQQIMGTSAYTPAYNEYDASHNWTATDQGNNYTHGEYYPQRPTEPVGTIQGYLDNNIQGKFAAQTALDRGIQALSLAKPALGGTVANVLGDWIVPDKLNNMDEEAAIRNFKKSNKAANKIARSK